MPVEPNLDRSKSYESLSSLAASTPTPAAPTPLALSSLEKDEIKEALREVAHSLENAKQNTNCVLRLLKDLK